MHGHLHVLTLSMGKSHEQKDNTTRNRSTKQTNKTDQWHNTNKRSCFSHTSSGTVRTVFFLPKQFFFESWFLSGAVVVDKFCPQSWFFCPHFTHQPLQPYELLHRLWGLGTGKKEARKNVLGVKKMSKKRCRHLFEKWAKCVVDMPWHEIIFWIAAHFYPNIGPVEGERVHLRQQQRCQKVS